MEIFDVIEEGVKEGLAPAYGHGLKAGFFAGFIAGATLMLSFLAMFLCFGGLSHVSVDLHIYETSAFAKIATIISFVAVIGVSFFIWVVPAAALGAGSAKSATDAATHNEH